MIKILLGGSPCTYWSIAQKNNRETIPSGLGWELFENYLIAKEKFKPDIFLYENNKSAAQPIKDEIRKRLGVWDNTVLSPDTGARYIEINSALVSAQNRQRFYVHNCGEVEQPQDRHIYLRDVLEMTTDEKGYALAEPLGGEEKAYCLTASYDGAVAWNTLERKQRTMVVEPVILQTPRGKNNGGIKTGKSPTLTANGAWQENNKVVEPIRIGDIGSKSQAHRVYSCDGKSVTINAGGGGQGGKTGLYACPIDHIEANGKQYPIYEVKNGIIRIRGKDYRVKLADGFYIIRKLTIKECCRLQTLPDDYCRAVSNAQAYKGLGNGWTAEVIIHILQNALKNIPRDEEIVALSMYDGIGTGRYCLDKMGFTNVKYYAYEIDKYAMRIAMSNYTDIIQCGDAFEIGRDLDDGKIK